MSTPPSRVPLAGGPSPATSRSCGTSGTSSEPRPPGDIPHIFVECCWDCRKTRITAGCRCIFKIMSAEISRTPLCFYYRLFGFAYTRLQKQKETSCQTWRNVTTARKPSLLRDRSYPLAPPGAAAHGGPRRPGPDPGDARSSKLKIC